VTIGLDKWPLTTESGLSLAVETRKAGRKHSTGLGLTFCRMVAEAHGGRIWVDSEVGKGSTFTIAIPLVPAD